ncbi:MULTISPECIES: immunity protein YezG family protein [Vibrio]|uniref:Uncharacterized protein n=2 Tax=Vibrio TaxID=662 RepID=A0A1Z2SL32_VIBGA|nr:MULTISPECIES: immunity protein YezG family protein [Vibrio]ASA57901.1 hypothetical protein BSQ33_19510 [Vibrio gazogenes]
MTDDQKIYAEIGRSLWNIMPHTASEIYFYGDIFPKSKGCTTEFKLKKDSSISWFKFGENPEDVELFILSKAELLQKTEPYKQEPWTHFKATLTEAGKFKMDFAYIPEDDSWPGLFMKRVSELSLEEAEEKYIPEEEWKKCVDKYGS